MIKKIIISFLIFVSFSSVVFAQPYKIYKGNEVRLSDRIELKKMFIDSFSIDGTFSSSADTKLSSSLAIKTYVDSQVSASTKWVTDANGINSDGDNIGINTDASATRAINSIGDVTFRLGSLNNAWFKDSTTAYNIASIWGTGTDGNISILSNTDENIRFSANGNSFILNDNFGLGVLSPTERLEVDGNITGTNIDLTNAISIGSSYGSAGYLLTSNNGGVMTWTDPASLGGGGVSDTLFQITNASNLAGIASPIQNDIAINATSDTIWIYDDTGIWTVSFSGGGGGYWTQTGNYVYPTTLTDLIGIGTATPESELHVKSNSLEPITITLNDSGDRPSIRMKSEFANTSGYAVNFFRHTMSNTVTEIEAGHIGAFGQMRADPLLPTLTYMYLGAEETVAYNNNTLRLYPDKTAYFDGNVGIGTTTPTATLHVQGSDALATSDALIVQNSALTDLFHIQNDGKIGIGKVTPTYPVDIEAADDIMLQMKSTDANMWMSLKDATTADFIGFGAKGNNIHFRTDLGDIIFAADAVGGEVERMRLKNTGQLQLLDYGIGGITGTMAYGLGFEADGSVIEVTPSEFNTWQGNWIRNGSDLYAANTTDSIGIGTTDPKSILHVKSGVSASMLFESNNNAALYARSANASPSTTLNFENALGTVGVPTYLASGKGLGTINFKGYRASDASYQVGARINATAIQDFSGSAIGTELLFSVAPAGFGGAVEKMRLTGAGLGIGTTSPGADLGIEDTGTASIKIGDGTKNWEFSHATGDGNLVLTTSADDDFEIHSTGGVFSKFSAFNGDFQTYTTQIHNGTTWKNALRNSASGNALQLGSTTAADWANVYIPDNVGINILAPATANLHIAENSSAASQIRLTNDDTGHTATDGLEVGVSSTGSIAIINNRENDDLNLATNNTVRLSIQEDGDVGIGTSSPTAELEVVGNFELSGNIILDVTNNIIIATGSGTPEAVLTAGIGSTYHRSDGGTGTSFYVKESGTGNTGWVAK